MSRTITAAQLAPLHLSARAFARLAERARSIVPLAFAGDLLIVHCEDPRLAGALVDKYREHVTLPAAEGYHFYIGRGPGDEHHFVPAGGAGWVWRDGPIQLDTLLFLADAAAVSSFMYQSAGIVSFHAAAVRYRDRAAIIAGDSTAGKTTTMLACALRRMPVYSDERALIAAGALFPFRRALSLRAGSLPLLFGTTCAPQEPLRTIPAMPAPLGAVFILAGHASATRIDPITAFAAAPALLRWMQCNEHSALARLRRMLATLGDAPCYRLELGPPHEAAAAIAACLAQTDGVRARAS